AIAGPAIGVVEGAPAAGGVWPVLILAGGAHLDADVVPGGVDAVPIVDGAAVQARTGIADRLAVAFPIDAAQVLELAATRGWIRGRGRRRSAHTRAVNWFAGLRCHARGPI